MTDQSGGSLIQEVRPLSPPEVSSLSPLWVDRASQQRPSCFPERRFLQVKNTPVVEGSIHPLGALPLSFAPRLAASCHGTFFCPRVRQLLILHVLCLPEHLASTLVLLLHPKKRFPRLDNGSYYPRGFEARKKDIQPAKELLSLRLRDGERLYALIRVVR